MKRVLFGVVLAAGVLSASPGAAQGILPFSLEARGGLAFPAGDFPTGIAGDEAGADNGVGFGVNATFNFLPGVAVYAGWDRYAFGVDEATLVGGEDAEFIDQGFAVGGRLSLPVGGLFGASPWVGAGALIRTLDLTSDGALGFDSESGRSTGFEAGGGLDIPLGLVLSFTPGVIYRSYEPDFGADGGSVSYVDVSLGLRARI